MASITQGGGRDNRFWTTTGCLTGAIFLSTLGISVFVFAIPLLALHDNISSPLLGAAFSGYFFAKLIIAPLAGKISDSQGPRLILVGSALTGTLLPLLYLFSEEYQMLYLIQFGLGLAAGAMKPVSAAVVASLVPSRDQGKAFSLYNALINAAFFLGPVLGGLLFYNRNLGPILCFLAACMGLSTLILYLALPADLQTIVSTASPDLPQGSLLLHHHKKSLPAHNERTLWAKMALLMAISGRTLCTGALLAFYPAVLAENLHGPTWVTGLLFALPSLTTFLILPLGGWMADKYDKKILALAGMTLSAVCLLLIQQAHTGMIFILIGLALGLGSAFSFPSSMAFASSLGLKQGQTMGWFHAAANVGFVLGPLLGGAVAHSFTSIPAALAVAGLCGLALLIPLTGLILPPKSGILQRAMLMGTSCIAVLGISLWTLEDYSLAKDTPTTSHNATGQQYAGVAMGNIVHMTLFGPNAEQGGIASQKAFATISRLEAECGHRNYSGSVGQVNLAAGKAPVKVSKPVFDIIKRSLDVSKASNGTFDITIGAITVLPQYYREKAQWDKKELVDYRKIVLDETKRTVFLPQKGMAIDLGGLAKGSIIDSAAQTLRENGATSALVEAGGDLYCFGDRTWKVGIQNPRGDGLLGVIEVKNAGVCGSGDYYQYAFTEEDGTQKRKHHIIDPGLLDSADKSVAVTVIAPSAELADALATTLFILGPKDGQKLLQNYPKCSALWILPDIRLVPSKNFPAFLEE